jgi:23S rRNA pseudouridine1911/1915/1917 synthase
LKNETFIVNESNIRLDVYLAERIEDMSRSLIQNYIKNGSILVNDEIRSSSYRLNKSDIIKFSIEFEENNESTIKPQNIPLDIIFEDEDIIVINKQAGLTIHPGVGNRDGTLANALVYHFKELSTVNGPVRPGIVHRLDQDTSGLVIVAKNNASHMRLSEQFSSRKVKKTYFGITWGRWNETYGMIDQPIGRKRSDPTTYQVSINGKIAETIFEVFKETEYFTYMDFYPKTGRTHQIRVHSAYHGNPIVGDEKYHGGKSRIKGYLPEVIKKMESLFKNINGHILHATKISFTHPRTGSEVNFESDIPKNILKIIKQIETLNV